MAEGFKALKDVASALAVITLVTEAQLVKGDTADEEPSARREGLGQRLSHNSGSQNTSPKSIHTMRIMQLKDSALRD